MSFTSMAETELTGGRPGDVVTVGADRYPMLVFDGPGDLETVIRFDRVVVTRNTIEFYLDGRSRGEGARETGSIERTDRLERLLRETAGQMDYDYHGDE